MTFASRDREDTGTSRPENWMAGSVVRIADGEDRRDLGAHEGRDQQAEPGGRDDVEQSAQHERRAAALDRHLEQEHRQRAPGKRS